MARSLCMLLRLLLTLFAFEQVLCMEPRIGFHGKSVQLECDIEKASPPQIKWTDQVHNSGRDPAAITAPDGSLNPDHPNFKNLELDADTNVLTIKNFSEDDSGKYKCTSLIDENTDVEKEYNIVYLEIPQCEGESDVHSGRPVHLSCSLGVVGDLQPEVAWYRGDKPVLSSEEGSVVKLHKVLHFNASVADNEQTFTCRVAFKSMKEECSVTLNVKYPVSEVRVSPMQDKYQVGDEIHCSGNGNPQPTAVWEGVTSNNADSNAAVLLVTKDMLGKDAVTYTCSVSNEIDGKKDTLNKKVTFSVEAATTAASSGGPKTAGIVIGVIVAIIVVVVIVVAVICIRRGRSRDKGSKPIPQDDVENKQVDSAKA